METVRLLFSGKTIPSFQVVLCVALMCFLFSVRPAAAAIYGTLSNFDVINDTGQECHGFEIELDGAGISSSSVTYFFGAPYERYGNPTVVPTATGVIVRYASTYTNGKWDQTTPLAPSPTPATLGHQCWTGGDPKYPTSGCEHFGVSLIGNPTTTTYRWLIADPNAPGQLLPLGTKVSIPAPTWNVLPPPNPGVPPVVQAVLPAVPPEVVEAQCGDAQWVKVFVTESADPPAFDHLHHLVTDDPAVPQEPGETEMEWVILQDCPGGENELANEGQVGDGAQLVTRRYEFYKYTGAYDPESHEALCGGDGSCNAPLDGELGDFIGAQMAALDLNPNGDLDRDGVSDANDLCSSTPPGQVVDANGCSCAQKKFCDDDNACTADSCDAVTAECKNVTVADGAACNDGNACTLTDTCQAGICTGANPVICSVPDQCHDVGACDPASGQCTNPTKANGTSCNDGSACTQTDTCQAGICTGTNPVICSAPDQCHDVGVCDPANGACSTPTKPDGTACEDGLFCTVENTCQVGTCSSGQPRDCANVSDQCSNGVCDEEARTCEKQPKPQGTSCEADSDACTIDQCNGQGQCVFNSLAPLCGAHDLAVTKIIAPLTVTLPHKKPGKSVLVKVQMQNRSGHDETIANKAMLKDLVSLRVESLGACSDIAPVLYPHASVDTLDSTAGGPAVKLPVTLKSKETLNVVFDVLFNCANDGRKSTTDDPNHEDYRYEADVHHSALDGNADTHPADDSCPRDPLDLDPNPDGTIEDKGCATVLTDIVKP